MDNCKKAAVDHFPTASTTATIQMRIFKNRRMLYLMNGRFRVLTNPSTIVAVDVAVPDTLEGAMNGPTQ